MNYVLYCKGEYGAQALPIDTVSWLRLLDLALKHGWQPRNTSPIVFFDTLADSPDPIFPTQDASRQPNLLSTQDKPGYSQLSSSAWQSLEWERYDLPDYTFLDGVEREYDTSQWSDITDATRQRTLLRRARNAVIDSDALSGVNNVIAAAKLSRWHILGGYMYIPPTADVVRAILNDDSLNDCYDDSYDDDDAEADDNPQLDYGSNVAMQDVMPGKSIANKPYLDVWMIDSQDRCSLAAALATAIQHMSSKDIAPAKLAAAYPCNDYVTSCLVASNHGDIQEKDSILANEAKAVMQPQLTSVDAAIRMAGDMCIPLSVALTELTPEEYFSGSSFLEDVCNWLARVEPAMRMDVFEQEQEQQPNNAPRRVYMTDTHYHTPLIIMGSSSFNELLRITVQPD